MRYKKYPPRNTGRFKISLRELWEIIARRKWLVFLTVVVCVGLAVAYVGLATTV